MSSATGRLSSIRSGTLFIDARIPVEFLACEPARAAPARVLLLSPAMPEPGATGWMRVLRLPAAAPEAAPADRAHGSGCACCTGRSEQARALTQLFHARARGTVGFFRAVTAVLLPEEAAVLRAVLRSDPFVSGCYVAADATITDNV